MGDHEDLAILPSFFKILLDPTGRPHLPLPPDFVRKHLKNKKILESQIVLQSVSGGFSWRLKIKKHDNMYSFADGWKKVVEDTGLVFGDFLVFWLVDHSNFKVVIFGTNGCQKVLPSKIKLELEEEKEEENDEEEEEEEDEDEDNDDDDDDDNDDDDDAQEDEEEEDDEGDHVDRDEVNPSFMTTISRSDNYHLWFPSKFARLAGLEKERMIRMKNLQGNKEWSICLQSETANYNRYYLASGWSVFRKANQISEGDECVFKFIRSQDKLCLAKHTKKVAPVVAVITKRPRGRPPRVEVVKRPRCRPQKKDDNLSGEVAAAVVMKRPRGRPPRVEVERKDRRAGAEVVVKRSVGRPVKRKKGGPTL